MIANVVRLLQEAKRPIFIWGAGIRAYKKEALALARSLGIPVATTWGAIDCIDHHDPLMAGGFGTHGTRAANFAVQNSDLVISIGCRLDTKSTGHPPSFARAARIVMVDIDRAEIGKFDRLGRTIDIGLCMDAGEFIGQLSQIKFDFVQLLMNANTWGDWIEQIQGWRKFYDNPVVPWSGINPYELMKEIGKWTTKDDVICSDTGCALGWMMQAFPFKGERFLHAFNQTPMGYGLPAAVGSAFARKGRVILITGDGSLMMSLPELATVARWALNIKIILLNNQGHAMCRQTQRQWLGGRYPATSLEGGLGFPDFRECVESFGVQTSLNMDDLFYRAGPDFLEVKIDPDAGLIPQCKYGDPLEDADPKLPREELKQQMIVETLHG